MSKKKIFITEIKTDVFPSKFILGIGDMDLFKARIIKSYQITMGDPTELSEYLEEFNGLEKGWFIPNYIYCKEPDINTLIHEILHFALSEFDRLGIEVSLKNDETFCYYVSSLLEQAVVKINKKFGKDSLIPKIRRSK